jgi:hypothetical protein
MNYSYQIIENNKEETVIIEYNYNNYSNKPEMWFISSFVYYNQIWKDNDSFIRTKEWISNNYPELLI